MEDVAEDRYVDVNGLRTRYWASGDRGSPLVLVHGLAGSADVWMYNIQPLADQHRVYVPDLPGFGRSDQPGPEFSPFDFADFLDEFMRLLHIDRPSLVGQSLGGGIALHYALRFPGKVNKLVLVDSAGLGREVIWTLRLLSLPLLGELFFHPTQKGVELFFNRAVNDSALITRDFVDLYYHFFSRPGFRASLLRLLRRIVTVRGGREQILGPVKENLQKIDRPVLIIWGGNDHVLPLKHGYFARQKLPDARLEIIEGCGHLPFFERPDTFNELALAFLRDE